MKMRLLTLALISTFFLFGCQPKPIFKYSTVIPKSESKNISIYVSEFTDKRPEKDSGTLGVVYNAYGIPYGDIREPENITVTKWVTDALIKELQNAGYNVLEDKNTTFKTEGEITHLSAKFFWSYDGTIYLQFRLKKDDNIVLNKLYKGNANKIDITQLSLDNGVSDGLELCLQDGIKQVVSDINKTL